MPLAPGKGKKTVANNIAELHTGNTYAKTKKKFGKKKADRHCSERVPQGRAGSQEAGRPLLTVL